MKFIFIFLFSNLVFLPAHAGVFLELLPGTEKIYRGRAPQPFEMRQIRDAGVTSVLIFKNQIKSEVDEEVSQLMRAGIDEKKIHNIPFLWKDFSSERLACEQVIEALQIMQEVQNSENDKILFHCTVGEDRTGLLAGLMTQLLEIEDTEQSFVNQMCAKGYAGGNANKPRKVIAAVDQFLTPLYFKISRLIEAGLLSSDNLNKRVCARMSDEVAISASRCQ